MEQQQIDYVNALRAYKKAHKEYDRRIKEIIIANPNNPLDVIDDVAGKISAETEFYESFRKLIIAQKALLLWAQEKQPDVALISEGKPEEYENAVKVAMEI